MTAPSLRSLLGQDPKERLVAPPFFCAPLLPDRQSAFSCALQLVSLALASSLPLFRPLPRPSCACALQLPGVSYPPSAITRSSNGPSPSGCVLALFLAGVFLAPNADAPILPQTASVLPGSFVRPSNCWQRPHYQGGNVPVA